MLFGVVKYFLVKKLLRNYLWYCKKLDLEKSRKKSDHKYQSSNYLFSQPFLQTKSAIGDLLGILTRIIFSYFDILRHFSIFCLLRIGCFEHEKREVLEKALGKCEVFEKILEKGVGAKLYVFLLMVADHCRNDGG